MTQSESPRNDQEQKQRFEPNMFRTFLRVWLPFPLMLATILVVQLSRGDLKQHTPEAEASPPVPAMNEIGEELPSLMESLATEREAVNQQRRDLEFAQKRILLEQKEIAERQQEVEKLLQRAESRFGKLENDRTQMLAQLARVYETMKASTAAEIIAALDVEMATAVLRRMKEKKAAEIMAKLPPDAAGRISREMLR